MLFVIVWKTRSSSQKHDELQDVVNHHVASKTLTSGAFIGVKAENCQIRALRSCCFSSSPQVSMYWGAFLFTSDALSGDLSYCIVSSCQLGSFFSHLPAELMLPGWVLFLRLLCVNITESPRSQWHFSFILMFDVNSNQRLHKIKGVCVFLIKWTAFLYKDIPLWGKNTHMLVLSPRCTEECTLESVLLSTQ